MPKLMKQTNKSISRLYLQLSKSFSQERNVCFKSENKNGYYFIEGNAFIPSECSFPQKKVTYLHFASLMPITKYIALYNNKKKWAAFRLDFSGSFKPALSKVCTRVCTLLWVYTLLSFNRGFNCRNFCSSQLRQFTIWIHICSHFKERGDFKSLKQTKSKLNSFPYKLQVCLTNEIIVALWPLCI